MQGPARPRGANDTAGATKFDYSNLTRELDRCNYGEPVRVDLENLLDADEVASLLELSSRSAISVYRSRYTDFPEPVLDRGTGKCRFWLRAEVEAWRRSHPHRRKGFDSR